MKNAKDETKAKKVNDPKDETEPKKVKDGKNETKPRKSKKDASEDVEEDYSPPKTKRAKSNNTKSAGK